MKLALTKEFADCPPEPGLSFVAGNHLVEIIQPGVDAPAAAPGSRSHAIINSEKVKTTFYLIS